MDKIYILNLSRENQIITKPRPLFMDFLSIAFIYFNLLYRRDFFLYFDNNYLFLYGYLGLIRIINN